QSTWEPIDNILDPLLIAEFDSKREEWRKKQRMLRKKRKLRLASSEHMSDTADSEQDELVMIPSIKKRAQSQENLWPYLPSDRLPLLWGSPPRPVKERKVKQIKRDIRTRGLKDSKDQTDKSESGMAKKKSRKELSVIKEENEKRRNEDEEDDDDEEEEEEDDDDDKWSSTDCWAVKYSPALTSSPGEPNVLRVHRVRSDVDYSEREASPPHDTPTRKDSPLNNNIYMFADSIHHSQGLYVNETCNQTTESQDVISQGHPAPTDILSENQPSRRCSHDDDEDDWNFGTKFQNQVNRERERLEAQILKEQQLQEESIFQTNAKGSSVSRDHPRSNSYSSPDQYHHKKLHHAKRRNTLDSSQNITVTDVDCHQIKITFVESASGHGFFKEMQTARTG
ncbi:hypothetical protein Btru_074165, partial [Bulinus truncatus]